MDPAVLLLEQTRRHPSFELQNNLCHEIFLCGFANNKNKYTMINCSDVCIVLFCVLML